MWQDKVQIRGTNLLKTTTQEGKGMFIDLLCRTLKSGSSSGSRCVSMSLLRKTVNYIFYIFFLSHPVFLFSNQSHDIGLLWFCYLELRRQEWEVNWSELPSFVTSFYLHRQACWCFIHSRSSPADLQIQMEPKTSISDNVPAVPNINLGYKLYIMTEQTNKWRRLWHHFSEKLLSIGSILGFHYFQQPQNAWNCSMSRIWAHYTKEFADTKAKPWFRWLTW